MATISTPGGSSTSRCWRRMNRKSTCVDWAWASSSLTLPMVKVCRLPCWQNWSCPFRPFFWVETMGRPRRQHGEKKLTLINQAAATDGQDAGSTSEWSVGVRRRDDHVGSAGGDEQQDQDDEAANVWVPRQGVLQ